MQQIYRLGLDVGANSIGWCALSLNSENQPIALLDLGVRVYPDGRNPKDGTSLAAQRRAPRAMRRNRDRYLQRRENLLNALTRFGLMPAAADARRDVAALDPYTLRAAALQRPLTAHELGRVVFHLNQHRGFASNRKTDRDANEGGLIKDAAANTITALQRDGHLTIGSWLADRHAKKVGVRVRLSGSGKTAAYPFYPTRDMVRAEFDIIWDAQAGWNAALTPTMRAALHHIIFYQRPLKPVQAGRCWLEPDEYRAPRALPSTQRFRIAQMLANLRCAVPGAPEAGLTVKQKTLLTDQLYRGRDLTMDQIRKQLGLPADADFTTREEKIAGCATAARLAHGKKAAIGGAWYALPLVVQDAVVAAMIDADTDEDAADALITAGIPPELARRAAACVLPDGHASLSSKAITKILPHLENGHVYNEAVKLAGYAHHSDRRTGEIRQSLPYYGELLCDRIGTGSGISSDTDEKRLGRAPNPTVHMALNEIRRVVNAVIAQHGPPAEIVIETLRDLGRSKRQREDYEKEQRNNRDANDARRSELQGFGLPVNSRNLMRLRLWHEQAYDPRNRMCPYTGTLITARMALSDAIEEDHILPFAQSLDDSAANRMLITREANRAKARRAPAEAFSHTAEWPLILERVAVLPENKRWRFQPEALAKYAKDGDFLARHLADSATIAIWAKDYLEVLSPGRVWTTPGRLTALIRHGLGLGSATVLGRGAAGKDRNDHRHHAIDAAVVALTDRSTLKRVTDAARKAGERGERLMTEFSPPWEGFVADMAARAATLVVSHKPDTGWQGALHNDTAYGKLRNERPNGHNVVVRRPLETLAGKTPEDVAESVADTALGAKIAAILSAAPDSAACKAALASFTHSGGHAVKRVRVTERLDSTQAISDRATGAPYKLVKRDGNHHAELWKLPNGKAKLVVVPIFHAAQQAIGKATNVHISRPHPAARLLMRLHKNDYLLFTAQTGAPLMRVVKMSGGTLVLAAHNEAGDLKRRDADSADIFKYQYASASALIAGAARKVCVLPDGRRRWGSPPL